MIQPLDFIGNTSIETHFLGTAVFSPLWLSIRRQLQSYENQGLAARNQFSVVVLDVNGFMKYDAPLSNSLKNKNSIELWCATWPMRIFLEYPEFHEIQDYQMISKIIKSRVALYFDQMLYIPKGTESKYQNTLKFVDGVFTAMEKNHKEIQGKRIKFREFFVARRCLSLPDFFCSLSRLSGALPGTGSSWRCAV